MSRQNIDLGIPPLLWSNVQTEFQKINNNFIELYSSVSGSGGEAVDFTNMGTNIVPRNSEVYDLGTPSKRWKDLYLSGNSLWLGNAQITSTGTSVNLPPGTTIDGLRVDENYFKYIAIPGQTTIEADEGTDTLTIAGGGGITVSSDGTTDTVLISNVGVIQNIAGTGISVSGDGTGTVTISNDGVSSVVAGTGIGVSTGTGNVTITNVGVTSVDAGNGIILDTSTGAVTITNGSPASSVRCFEYVSIPGQAVLRADNNSDTLNITASSAIVLTTDGGSDTLNISFNNNVDIVGSIFADNSAMLVDATGGRIIGPLAESISMEGGAILDSSDSNFEVRGVSNVNLEAESVVNITTDSQGTGFTWQFGDDGALDTPSNLKIAKLSDYSPSLGTMMIQAANESIHIVTPGDNSQIVMGWTSTNGLDTASISFNADSDALESVKISAGNFGGTVHGWIFGSDGLLTLPGGAIVDSADSNFEVRGITDVNLEAEGLVSITSDAQGTPHEWTFNADGTLSTPGFSLPAIDGSANAVLATNGAGVSGWVDPNVRSYVSKTGGFDGVITGVSLSPPSNVNWVPGTYPRTITGGSINASITFTVDGSFNISATITGGGAGFSVSQTITVPGTAFGGLTPTHDLTVTVTSVSSSFTALDLTKSVQKLANGNYSLGDGTEGQIMHFALQESADIDTIVVKFANLRSINSSTGVATTSTNASWRPFDKTNYSAASLSIPGLITALFLDGAWAVTSGLAA